MQITLTDRAIAELHKRGGIAAIDYLPAIS